MDQEVQKKKFYKRWWFWVGTAAVLFLVIGLSSGDSSDPSTVSSGSASTQSVVAIKVSAEQIVGDYKDNGVAADAKYKDKLVEISGVVDTIDKDILDTPYITLESYKYAIVDRVQCMFSRADEAQLAAVAKGQNITLQGTVSGKLGNVVVKDCKIIK